MPENDDTQRGTAGPYPVWADRDDQVRCEPPTTYVDDPIAADHWDESKWKNAV